MTKDFDKPSSCQEPYLEITEKDLPLSCPSRLNRVWDAHPRVYLPIEDTGKEICPYCGAQYVLKREASHHD